MKAEIPSPRLLIKKMSNVESTFDGKTKKIEEWRKHYLLDIKRNRELSDIEIFKRFVSDLLIRATRGERGSVVQSEIHKYVNSYLDLNRQNLKRILKGYRFGIKNGSDVVLKAKEIAQTHKFNWSDYFEEAENDYKRNFPGDEFLKIKNVGYKVRDLALSDFSKYYSANDLHVVRVISRTGLLMYGYGIDYNFGTNVGDKKQYLFFRKLIIRLSEMTGMSPGELDRIFWHFGRTICSNSPNCGICPITNQCSTKKYER